MKFPMCIDKTFIEGSVSQIIELGPSFYLMKCGQIGIEKAQNVSRFFYIKEKLRPSLDMIFI